jgi:hypothetical protein
VKHKAILNVSFAIYKTNGEKLNSSFDYNGKALRVIEGDNLEDCLNRVKEFFKKSGFSITKEQPNEPVRGNDIKRSH